MYGMIDAQPHLLLTKPAIFSPKDRRKSSLYQEAVRNYNERAGMQMGTLQI